MSDISPTLLLDPDGATNHSTKASKNDAQVAAYLPQAGKEAGEKFLTAASPCIGHCTTVLGDEVCRSCLRTFDEITSWPTINDEQRSAINQRIATLLEQQL